MAKTTFPRNRSAAFWMEQDDAANHGVTTRYNTWDDYDSRAPRSQRFDLSGEEDY